MFIIARHHDGNHDDYDEEEEDGPGDAGCHRDLLLVLQEAFFPSTSGVWLIDI